MAASPGALGLGIRLRRAHMADGAEARLQANASGQPGTLCSAEYCTGVTQGAACDELGRACPYPCGPDAPVYRCTEDGWDGTNLAC